MIQRFRFGLPLPTDSVVQEIPVSAGPVPFLTAEEDGWAYRMAPDAIVYEETLALHFFLVHVVDMHHASFNRMQGKEASTRYAPKYTSL